MSQYTDQEAHDLLAKLADEHHRTKLGGVDPPSREVAAAGTMRDEPEAVREFPPLDLTEPVQEFPPMDLTEPAAPSPLQGNDAQPQRRPMDLSKPLGPMHDTELEGLQSDARARRATASLGRAVTDYAERPDHLSQYAQRLGGGGVSPGPAKSTLWNDYEAEGEQAVKDLGDRRKSEAGMRATSLAAAANDEKLNPQSETAKTYRAVLYELSPALKGQLDGATPAQMEKIAPWIESYAKTNAEALKAKAAAEAKAADEAAKKAESEKRRGEDLNDRRQTHADSQANAEALRALAGKRIDVETEAKDQAGAQHLGDKAGETLSAAKALDDIDAVIAKNPDDIPGIGRAKSLVPEVLKPIVLSEEGQNLRSNAKDVLGVLLHKRSGAAVSPAELRRYEAIYGLNGDDAQFKDGMQRLRRDFAEELRGAEAGVSPGARKKFKEGGGKLADDVLKAPAASPADVVDVVDKNGTHYHPPAAEADALRAELKADGLL